MPYQLQYWPSVLLEDELEEELEDELDELLLESEELELEELEELELEELELDDELPEQTSPCTVGVSALPWVSSCKPTSTVWPD